MRWKQDCYVWIPWRYERIRSCSGKPTSYRESSWIYRYLYYHNLQGLQLPTDCRLDCFRLAWWVLPLQIWMHRIWRLRLNAMLSVIFSWTLCLGTQSHRKNTYDFCTMKQVQCNGLMPLKFSTATAGNHICLPVHFSHFRPIEWLEV